MRIFSHLIRPEKLYYFQQSHSYHHNLVTHSQTLWKTHTDNTNILNRDGKMNRPRAGFGKWKIWNKIDWYRWKKWVFKHGCKISIPRPDSKSVVQDKLKQLIKKFLGQRCKICKPRARFGKYTPRQHDTDSHLLTLIG